jgi:hypothetical protein
MICSYIKRDKTLLSEHLKENSEGYTNKILLSNGCSYTAVWKRMLGNEKERHAKTTSSKNAILKIHKGMHKNG